MMKSLAYQLKPSNVIAAGSFRLPSNEQRPCHLTDGASGIFNVNGGTI